MIWLVVYGMCDFGELFISSEQPRLYTISENHLWPL